MTASVRSLVRPIRIWALAAAAVLASPIATSPAASAQPAATASLTDRAADQVAAAADIVRSYGSQIQQDQMYALMDLSVAAVVPAARLERWDDAQATGGLAHSLGGAIQQLDNNPAPTVDRCRVWAETGNVPDAFEFAQTIEAPDLKAAALAAIAQAAGWQRHELYPQITAAAREAIAAQVGNVETGIWSMDPYWDLMMAHRFAGDVEGARATVAARHSPPSAIIAQCQLAAMLAKRGDEAGAREAMRQATGALGQLERSGAITPERQWVMTWCQGELAAAEAALGMADEADARLGQITPADASQVYDVAINWRELVRAHMVRGDTQRAHQTAASLMSALRQAPGDWKAEAADVMAAIAGLVGEDTWMQEIAGWIGEDRIMLGIAHAEVADLLVSTDRLMAAGPGRGATTDEAATPGSSGYQPRTGR